MTLSQATAMIGTECSLFMGVNPYPQAMKGADLVFEKDGFWIVISGFGGNCLISTTLTAFVAPNATMQELLLNLEK